MKRTLALILVAISSAALAQTPAKTPTANAKSSPAAVKVVAVPQKPVVVAAKPASAQTATVKAVAVPAPRATVSVSPKPVAIAVPQKSVVVAAPAAHAVPASAKPVAVPMSHIAVVSGKPVSAPKVMVAPVKADPFKSAGNHEARAKVSSKAVVKAVKTSSSAPVAVQDTKAITDDKATKPVTTVGKRDPFVSPVVTMGATGSGCSSGKRCLAIDQVALRGVVKSDDGMIAVVVNSADKAYFLHENDPVFDGYVLKITGDSIVFKETFHDKLGKPLTRDVTKTISRPAV